MIDRRYFARDDASIDWIDLLSVPAEEPGAFLQLPVGDRMASAWAWVNAEVEDRKDRSPAARRRCSCAAIMKACSEWAERHRAGAAHLLIGNGWLAEPEMSQMLHLEAHGDLDGFMILVFNATQDSPNLIPPPVLLDVPKGILPPEPCGQCESCSPRQQDDQQECSYATVGDPAVSCGRPPTLPPAVPDDLPGYPGQEARNEERST